MSQFPEQAPHYEELSPADPQQVWNGLTAERNQQAAEAAAPYQAAVAELETTIPDGLRKFTEMYTHTPTWWERTGMIGLLEHRAMMAGLAAGIQFRQQNPGYSDRSPHEQAARRAASAPFREQAALHQDRLSLRTPLATVVHAANYVGSMAAAGVEAQRASRPYRPLREVS